jgi:hypothetical protein
MPHAFPGRKSGSLGLPIFGGRLNNALQMPQSFAVLLYTKDQGFGAFFARLAILIFFVPTREVPSQGSLERTHLVHISLA